MLNKELVLMGAPKKNPMMMFELAASSNLSTSLDVILNDGSSDMVIYGGNARNYLEGDLESDVDMVNFSIRFRSHKEDETCMNPGHPYYDKGQTCIVYDKDLNEIARTTYTRNCGHFYTDPMPISGLQYYTLQSDGYGYLDTYPQTITWGKTSIEASMEESVDAQQGITDDGWCGFRCYGCSEDSARKRRRKLSDYARSVLRSTLYKFSVASTNLSLRDCRVHDKSTKRNGPRYYWWQLRFPRCRSYTNRCNNKTQLHGEVQSIGQLRSTGLRIYVLAPQEALYA